MYFSSTCISGQTRRAQNQHPFSMKQIPPLSGEDEIETKSIRNKLLLLIFLGKGWSWMCWSSAFECWMKFCECTESARGCQKTALSAKSRKLGSCAGTNRFLDNCTILFFIGCFSEASFGFLWKTVCRCKHPSCRTFLCPKEMFGWLLAGWPSLSLWMDNKSLANDHFRLEATLQFYWASVIEFFFFWFVYILTASEHVLW